MSHTGFGRLDAVGEDDDSFVEVGDSRAGATRDDFAVAQTTTASSFTGSAAPLRSRAASHAPSASVQLPAGVAASLAQLSVKNSRAQGGSILAQRVRLPAMTQSGQHVFVRVHKGGAAPSLVTLSLHPPAPISPATASPATVTHSTLCVAAYSAPPPPVASAPHSGLAAASTSAAIMMPSGGGGALRPAPVIVPTASRSAGLIASGAAGLAGAILTQISTPRSPVDEGAPSPPPSVPSPPAATPPLSIPLSSLVSLTSGFKSKKFQALHPPAELEAAACTILYMDHAAGKEAKKKSLHLIGLHSKSVDAWMAALQDVVATPSGSAPSLDSALRAADTLSFDNANAGDVHYHSLIARHFPTLVLPPSSQPAGANGAANGSAAAGSAGGGPVAPRVPSRRGSLFHNEYSATKGFTTAPSHTRSQTAADILSLATAHSPLPPGHSPPLDLLSPTLTRAVDVLPLLRRGSYFLKFGRAGNPHFRFFQLSADCLTLCPFEKSSQVGSKVPVKAMDLRAIERVQMGHASPRFKGVPSSLASLSLTIQLRSDTHADPSKHVGPSLIACSPFGYNVWTRGLVHLLRALAEHDSRQAAATSSAAPPALLSSEWPPRDLVLDIPRADDGSDGEFTDFTSVKGVDGSAIKKLMDEWVPDCSPA